MILLSFDPFSLDYFYDPVSAIMWLWYKAFSAVPGLGPASFFTWTLSVMFLVFSLRAILYSPFVRQIRTTRQMQEYLGLPGPAAGFMAETGLHGSGSTLSFATFLRPGVECELAVVLAHDLPPGPCSNAQAAAPSAAVTTS